MTARLYLRRNGTFSASVSDCLDTGHCIHEDNGKFTVWSIDGSGTEICTEATRAEAEKAIADDWKQAITDTARALIRDDRPACPYCTGIMTGLPGNACENCMNTGYADATPEDLK